MRKGYYGKYFCVSRKIIRRLSPKWQNSSSLSAEPCVYVAHHQNFFAPIHIMLWFDSPLRIWVLRDLCQIKSCRQQFTEYTFSKRFGWPKLLSKILAYPAAAIVAPLFNSARAIPVYRGSRQMLQTMRESVAALISGQSLLICPDVDYTNSEAGIGSIYKGFLHLEREYYRQTDKHLPFVPLALHEPSRTLQTGQALYFQNGIPFREEKERLAADICTALNKLSTQTAAQQTRSEKKGKRKLTQSENFNA